MCQSCRSDEEAGEPESQASLASQTNLWSAAQLLRTIYRFASGMRFANSRAGVQLATGSVRRSVRRITAFSRQGPGTAFALPFGRRRGP